MKDYHDMLNSLKNKVVDAAGKAGETVTNAANKVVSDEMRDKVAGAAHAVGDRAKYASRMTRMTVDCNAELERVKRTYTEIGRLYCINGKAFKKRLSELSELLDFGDLLNRTVGKLSGGQRRRIDIARALLHEPEILILDEPTTGLDPQTRLLLWSVVMQLRAEHGLTVFLTTHYMEEAADADYVVILDSGSIAAEGTPLELKNRFTGDFITLYGVTPEKAAALGEYRVESTRDGIRIAVKNTAEATQLILKHPELFIDYEIKKGGMDDVFLAATGKKLSGGVES